MMLATFWVTSGSFSVDMYENCALFIKYPLYKQVWKLKDVQHLKANCEI